MLRSVRCSPLVMLYTRPEGAYRRLPGLPATLRARHFHSSHIDQRTAAMR